MPTPKKEKFNNGFTLIELLVVIAIIALLCAFLFPVFASVREKGRQAACASNLSQIGKAILAYTADWDDMLPLNNNLDINNGADSDGFPFMRPLETFLAKRNRGVWLCPNDTFYEKWMATHQNGTSFTSDQYTSYIASIQMWGNPFPTYDIYSVRSLSSVRRPSSTIMMEESNAIFPQILPSKTMKWYRDNDLLRDVYMVRHQGKGNYLFADGHVKLLSVRQTLIPEVLWDNMNEWANKEIPEAYPVPPQGWTPKDIQAALKQLDEFGIP
jgi:prepilin-type N-terminal cleavage/methylation domain-containing protein/prepilin-type processing-associated H-X9-DG protein